MNGVFVLILAVCVVRGVVVDVVVVVVVHKVVLHVGNSSMNGFLMFLLVVAVFVVGFVGFRA